MKYAILIAAMTLLLAACAHQPEHEDEHYETWTDGGGWHPDYHDEENKPAKH